MCLLTIDYFKLIKLTGSFFLLAEPDHIAADVLERGRAAHGHRRFKLADELVHVDLEALFEMDNNVSIEDFLATYFPKDQFIAIIDSVSSNGTYTVEDGVVKLTIASETETVIYDGEADTITMDGEGLSDGDVVFHRAA